MRTSVLSRSVVVIAALAVGSAALAAAPATAATPSGITRDQVLTAASGIRAAYASGDDISKPTAKAVRAIVQRACAVNSDDGEILYEINGIPTGAGASADGLVAYGQIYNVVEGTVRDCVAGAIASSTPEHMLSGNVTVTAKVSPGDQPITVSAPLGGDVAVTPPISTAQNAFTQEPAMTASGAATRTVTVPAKTVKDRKTSKQKRAAKKKYVKKLASLEASYDRAVKKAGGSATKKAAAKKTYAARKKAAKAAYRYAIANYRIVTKATTTRDVRPFTLSLLLL